MTNKTSTVSTYQNKKEVELCILCPGIGFVQEALRAINEGYKVKVMLCSKCKNLNVAAENE